MTDKGFRSKKIRQFTSRLSFRIICGTVFLLLFFGASQSVVGYVEFTRSLTREYKESAFRTAETAVCLVDGNRIDEYIETSGSGDDYADMKRRLDLLCQKQNVSLIYVI